MVQVNAELTRDEYDAAIRNKGKRTWRDVILSELGIPHSARDIGRPRAHASDALDGIYVELSERLSPEKKEGMKFAADGVQ